MQYRLKFSGDHERAWQDLKTWGYPGDKDDYINVVFVEVGDAAAWIWFEYFETDQAAIHLCADPAHHGRWFGKHTLEGLRWAAEFMGLSRVHYFETEASPSIIAKYVQRLGWTQSELGWYLEV